MVDNSDCCRRLYRFESGHQGKIVSQHGRPDISLEAVKPFPGAAIQTIGSLEAGDVCFDPGAEIAQLSVDPTAFDHVFDGEAAFLVEGDIAHPLLLACCRLPLLA